MHGESEKHVHRNAMTAWSPDVWIVQHNIERLKRWIAMEYNDARKQQLTGLLDNQQRRLVELESDSQPAHVVV